ncbi:hypothetical protein [Bradyrhizobium genosp. SA-3]|uniref:hypothetical protein n=1 Tax=Bradyrhizobium genosp. SA-3 TaxID=508868 RepID=UPI00102A9D7F|nr:hypothetical protein [Bradyrhizobium genosp. SA-3]
MMPVFGPMCQIASWHHKSLASQVMIPPVPGIVLGACFRFSSMRQQELAVERRFGRAYGA